MLIRLILVTLYGHECAQWTLTMFINTVDDIVTDAAIITWLIL